MPGFAGHFCFAGHLDPHPEERPLGRVSKEDRERVARPWFETPARGGLLTMRLHYSACSSATTASPICAVLTACMPSDMISAVRSPFASTAATAASTLSASSPNSSE